MPILNREKSLPREAIKFIERCLQEYPMLCQELKARTAYLEALASPAQYTGVEKIDRGVGASALAPQERIVEMKESDEEFKSLTRKVERLKKALTKLGEEDLRFISLRYWQGCEPDEVCDTLGVSSRSFWHYRRKILTVIAPDILGVWGL